MLITPLHDRDDGDGDSGFTLLELVIAALLASIVLAMAGGALVSLSNAANRNESIVVQEQAASNALAQMERDIRSASSITFPTGVAVADQLELSVVGATGSTIQVLWVYNPAADTLTRETQVQGSFTPSGSAVSNVSNGIGTGVFTYYDFAASDISSTSPSNIEQCATGVGVDVHISSSTAGVAGFEESAEVALTNRIEALSAPGNGQCGSA